MVLRVEKAIPRDGRSVNGGENEWHRVCRRRGGIRVEEARTRDRQRVNGGPHSPREVIGERDVSKGYTVFVDGVSKRLHKSTLVKLFADYGEVVDAFVAYRSLKRRLKDYTFAVVRFKVESDMIRAINQIHNRSMDGFILRMSRPLFERKSTEVVKRVQSPKKSMSIRGSSPVSEGRSFKAALMSPGRGDVQGIWADEVHADSGEQSNMEGVCAVSRHMQTASQSGNERKKRGANGHYFVGVPRSEFGGTALCMVGKLSELYTIQVVRRAMELEEIPCTVSAWNEERVIIGFESVDAKNELLEQKRTFFDEWFDELQIYEPLVHRKRYVVQIGLHNLPLILWNSGFFHDVVERWGKVLSFDAETVSKTDLEIARIIIEAECPETIPRVLIVTVQGVRWRVGISVTKPTEVDRCSEPLRSVTDDGVDYFFENQNLGGYGGNQGIFIGNPLFSGSDPMIREDPVDHVFNMELNEEADPDRELSSVLRQHVERDVNVSGPDSNDRLVAYSLSGLKPRSVQTTTRLEGEKEQADCWALQVDGLSTEYRPAATLEKQFGSSRCSCERRSAGLESGKNDEDDEGSGVKQTGDPGAFIGNFQAATGILEEGSSTGLLPIPVQLDGEVGDVGFSLSNHGLLGCGQVSPFAANGEMEALRESDRVDLQNLGSLLGRQSVARADGIGVDGVNSRIMKSVGGVRRKKGCKGKGKRGKRGGLPERTAREIFADFIKEIEDGEKRVTGTGGAGTMVLGSNQGAENRRNEMAGEAGSGSQSNGGR